MGKKKNSERKGYIEMAPDLFTLRFYNPSPGNPELKNFEFTTDYIYVTWMDGTKNKVKVKKTEYVYSDFGTEEGMKIWFGENFILLHKVNEEEETEEDDEGQNNDEDEDS